MRMSVMRTLCEYIRVRENNAGRNYINYFKDYILPDENKIITTDKLPCEDDISTILDLSSKAGDDMAYMISYYMIQMNVFVYIFRKRKEYHVL